MFRSIMMETVSGISKFIYCDINTDCKVNRCFPHVINLAVQAIYATLKNESHSNTQYLLGNLPELTEEVLQMMPLPDDVMAKDYRTALAADVIGITRKLVSACRASGPRRDEFELTIREGNESGSWTDSEGNSTPLPVLQLLRDCEMRWSSTFLLLDRVLMLLPVRTLLLPRNTFSQTFYRQSRHLPHAPNRLTASYHRSCSAKQAFALYGTFTKLSKFRTLPRNFYPLTGLQHLPFPFQSTIKSSLSGS